MYKTNKKPTNKQKPKETKKPNPNQKENGAKAEPYLEENIFSQEWTGNWLGN